MPDEGMNARVDVRGYRISGNTVFDTPTLMNVIGLRTGSMTLAQVSDAADALTRYYHEHGYLVARVYVPQQHITDGIISLTVLEGRYDQTVVQGQSRVSDQRVQRTVNEGSCANERCDHALIDSDRLERGLLLLNDTPGVQATARLSPGAQTGTSALTVDTTPAPLIVSSASVDNGGNYYTGVFRGIGNLWINSPLGLGDQASVQAVSSADHGRMNYGALGYSMPVGYSGLRVGVRAWDMTYHLGDVYRPLDSHGRIYGGELTATYPLVRTTAANLSSSLSVGTRHFRDQEDTVGLSNWRRISGRVEWDWNGDLRDNVFGRPAINTVALSLVSARLRLDDQLAAFDQQTAHTAGRYQKVTFNYARLQQVTDSGALYLRWLGQSASRNLDAYEKLALGGPDAVRAYPVGDSTIDKGVLYTVEWRQQLTHLLGGPLEGTVFYDHASGYRNTLPYGAGANSAVIYGEGVGLNWTSPHRLTVRGYAAIRGDRAWSAAPNHKVAYGVLVSAVF